MRKIIKKILICATLFYSLYVVIFESGALKENICNAIERCVITVVPSLFAMMILSNILINSNFISLVFRPFDRIFKNNILGIFILSMFAGYPIGAKMLLMEYEKGDITKKQAEFYLCVFFGAGPAFILGCVSAILFNSINCGIYIILCTTISNLIIGIVIFKIMPNRKSGNIKKELFFNSEILVNATISSGKSMFNICLMVILFSIICCILQSCGVLDLLVIFATNSIDISEQTVTILLHSFLDVTNLSLLEKNNYTLLPIICGLISFGGVCIILQIKSIIGNKIGISKFILVRLIAGILSAFLCKIMMPIIIKNELLATTNLEFKIYQNISPIPSIMLIIMLLILCYELKNNRN